MAKGVFNWRSFNFVLMRNGMTPRTLLAAFLILASPVRGAETPHIRLNPFASGFKAPVALADDGTGRIFIVEQEGRICKAQDGKPSTDVYLDISSKVFFQGECGLLCMVFHPDFAKNGRLFVNYDTKGQDGKIQTVVSEFKTDPKSDTVDAGSERVILKVDQPFPNHKGGQLVFGKDGMLYIGFGDGGAGGDPGNRGQNLGVLLAKILRIDVDHKQPYAIPADNPFVGKEGALPEIWAYGVRNPWRFSMDRETGQFYCGEVGQNKWEEVDILEKGKNYGWSAREAFHDFKPERANGPMTDPIKEYPHADGNNSITGGYVYRGKNFPELQGIYIYGDFGSGRIWGLKWDGKALALDAELMHPSIHMSAFGEDSEGELYVIDYGGAIYRIAQ